MSSEASSFSRTPSLVVRAVLMFMAGVLMAPIATAAAGKVVFVSGTVTAEGTSTRSLAQGDAIDVGDTIVTAEKSRAQLLMGDGARIALRAGTRFRIDEFAMPANVQKPGAATAVAANGRSVATLLKGGFRTRTGQIGKTDPSAYEVRTPVGTLGIRGTDYTAVFCREDCADAPGLPPGQPIAQGLYIGVDEGRITFNGRGFSFELAAPGLRFVPLEQAQPQELTQPPAFLDEDGAGPLDVAGGVVRTGSRKDAAAPGTSDFNDRRSPLGDSDDKAELADANEGGDTEQTILATNRGGDEVDLTGGELPVSVFRNIGATIPAAAGSPALLLAGAPVEDTLTLFDANGGLIRFSDTGAQDDPVYEIGTASNAEVGTDAATGLSWGRWTGGSASVTTLAATSNLALTQSSLHWITGPSFDIAPALPIAGTATYVLADGTSPTDGSGNAGTLAGAFLNADFTAQIATLTLAGTIAGNQWYATGDAPLSAPANSFAAAFDTVLINAVVPGAGGWGAFFTEPAGAGAAPAGAGVAYFFSDAQSGLGLISGVAALTQGQGTAPAAPVAARNVAFALSTLGNASGIDASVLVAAPQYSTNAGGDLTGFSGPTGAAPAPSGAYALGSATVLDTGVDAQTGIRWGRWSNGAASVTTGQGAQAIDLTQQSLHYIASNPFGAAPALPVTGTATYVLAGATSPTHSAGDIGQFDAAFLSADFAAGTVTNTLTFTLNGQNYYATGTAPILGGTNRFSGNFGTVLVDGVISTTGQFAGFLSQPQFGVAATAGAGLAYDIFDPEVSTLVTSGSVAFRAGAGTPPPPPPPLQRLVALVVNDADGVTQVPVTSAALDSQFVFDSDGFVLSFGSAIDRGNGVAAAVLDRSAAGTVESGSDPSTGIRWARWAGDTATFTDAQGTDDITLEAQSLHFVFGNEFVFAPTLPATGTASFVLSGGTNPTEGFVGEPGSLDGLSFSADFTNLTVASALQVTVRDRLYYGSGSGTYTAGGLQFTGNFTSGEIAGLGPATGRYAGFFSPADPNQGLPLGAGIVYAIDDPSGGVGRVDGAAALVESVNAQPLGPPARGIRDVAVSLGPIGPLSTPQVASLERLDAADYGLDASFRLTRFVASYFDPNDGGQDAQFDLGTATVAESDYDTFVALRWGRWSGGSMNVAPSVSAPFAETLAANSVHWIMSGDADNPPVIPTTGAANYAYLGGTQPTDSTGALGTLTGTVAADFTNSTVTTNLNLTFPTYSATAAGNAIIGDSQFGLLPHQFRNSFGNVSFTDGNGTLTGTGSYSGFFSGGDTVVPVPAGVGLSFQLENPQLNLQVIGAGAFQRQ